MSPTISRTADYRIGNTTFRVTYGDITKITADAIVSSDDNYLSMGGGVSEAILIAGGDAIRREAAKHLPLKIGDVAITSGGNLSAKYIFHAVTIDYNDLIFPSEESIHTATLKCMQLVDNLGLRTIAFPALGTGVGRFPFQLAGEVMTRTISDYLIGDTRIELVTLTLFAREMVRESDLNLFYERAAAKASIYSQSKRLGSLMTELKGIIDEMNMPQISANVDQLKNQLEYALTSFDKRKTTSEDLKRLIKNEKEMREISRKTVEVSSQVQNIGVWSEKKLEAKVLRTKLSGLYAQANIQQSNLNRYEIERAKYGETGVPVRLMHAIEDLENEISDIEAQIGEVRKQLASLG